MPTQSSSVTGPVREFCRLTAVVRIVSNPERIPSRSGVPCVRRWACWHQGPGRPAWSFAVTACANLTLVNGLAAIETGDLIKVHGSLRYFETATKRGGRSTGHELMLESLDTVETVTVALSSLAVVIGAGAGDYFDPPPDWRPARAAPLTG